MKNHFLFPYRYRLLGWLLFLPSMLLGLACMYADFGFDFLTLHIPKNSEITGWKISDWPINLTDEVAALGVIAGLLMVGFSKEKVEDEMAARLRLDALQWSVYVNYAVLALTILLVHGGQFFNVMVYNMFTGLLVFVIRFRWLIFKHTRAAVGALAL